MKTKYLCYLSPSFYPATKYGGPIFSCLNTCRELINQGCDIEIHSTNVDKGGRLNVDTDHPVFVDELGGEVNYHNEIVTDRFSLQFMLKTRNAIKKSQIVHSQSIFSLSSPWAIYWGIKYGTKVVISPRGSLGRWCLEQGSIFKRVWLNIFFRKKLEYIFWHVTAEEEKQDVLNVFPYIPDDKFIIIPNGINRVDHVYLSKDELFEQLGLNVDREYALSVGRIDDKKGFDYTIEALSKLDEDIDLIILGDDYGSLNKLVALSENLGISERVHFVGHYDGIVKWSLYYHARFFTLNSRHENFGNVYLEALSTGTPILSSINTPWVFINDTGAGYCIENDVELIAAKMKELCITSKELDKQCRLVASNFYWDKLSSDFIAEYKRILNVS